MPPASYDGAVEADIFPKALHGKKLLALYDYDGEIELCGDFAIRLPEDMRPASMAEAEGVLLARVWYYKRGYYIGDAYNTHTEVYAWLFGLDTV